MLRALKPKRVKVGILRGPNRRLNESARGETNAQPLGVYSGH